MDTLLTVLQRLETKLDAADWMQPAFGVQQPLRSTGWHLQGAPSSWAQPSAAGADWTSGPLSSWDLPPARPVSSWDLPQSRPQYDQYAQRFPSSSSPDPYAYDPNLCSNPSDWNYSDSYAYDPPDVRPLTSWDLPRPRIESYGGGRSSQYMYGASRTHGDGGYAPYSYHGGGYSGGGYANERNSYAPPPPPPRDGYYVPGPQPNLLSYIHPQLAPWESPWYRTAPDSSAGDPQPEGCTEWQPMTSVYGLSTDSQQNAPSSVPVTSNEEDEFEKWQGEVREAETRAEVEIEAGLDTKTEDEFVSGVVKTEEEFVSDVEATLEVGEEPASGSSKSLLQAILLSPTDGDLYGVEQIELNVRGEEVASDPQIEEIDGKSRVVEGDNISSKLSCDSKLSNKPLGEAECEEYILVKAELREGDIKLEDVFLEVTRRLVIFGLYALAEVYKDLHLEDKVIFKGGGVDTSRFYFN